MVCYCSVSLSAVREHSASATCYICSLAFAFLRDHVCFSVAHRTHGSVFSRNAREVKNQPLGWVHSSIQRPTQLADFQRRLQELWLVDFCQFVDTTTQQPELFFFFSGLTSVMPRIFWIFGRFLNLKATGRLALHRDFTPDPWGTWVLATTGDDVEQSDLRSTLSENTLSTARVKENSLSWQNSNLDRTQTSRNLFKPRLFPPPSVQSWPETNRALSAAQETSSDKSWSKSCHYFFFSFILVGSTLFTSFFFGRKSLNLEFYCLSAVPPEPSGGWRCLHCVQCANYILVMCWMVELW